MRPDVDVLLRPAHADEAPPASSAESALPQSDRRAPPPLWVVTPTQGGRAPDLDRTLAALALEAPPRVVLTVIVDGPCPDTERLLSSWQRRADSASALRFRVFRTQGAQGPNYARDLSIRCAPNDAVIVEVDDHDTPEPGALRRVAVAFHNDAVQAVYADHFVVDRHDRLIRREQLPDYRPRAFERFCPARGLRAYRKTLYLAVGGYRAGEFPAGDHWLWLRFAERAGDHPSAILHLPRPLSRFKLCENSISVTQARAQARSSAAAIRAARSGTLCAAPFREAPEPCA